MKLIKQLFFATLLVANASYVWSQEAEQFICRNGEVHFFSSAPLEDIEATTKKAVAVLNTTSGKVVVKIPNSSFSFKSKLMEEHFNENYMESEKFPNSTLSATFEDMPDFTKDGQYKVKLQGSLDVHGVKRDRIISGILEVKDGVPVSATADFIIRLEDHKIKIPKAVIANIAEEVKVDVKLEFVKYQKK
jgi:polyisoprenoid-binding protein YceI